MSASEPDGADDRTIVAQAPGPAPARSLTVGSTLINGTYVIEAFLGSGGMGEVYRAKHIYEGNDYAIKVVLPELAKEETVLRLFLKEARELKRLTNDERLTNDAIVRYRDILRDEKGSLCLIMEFVNGHSLRALLRQRRFETAEVLALLHRIGQGLVAAHELGIVHRDISPENIILPGSEIARAKLIDFGIAKSLDSADHTLIGGDFAGKYSFVSPEQAGLFGGAVDHRSDIYSLGLVLATAALGFGNRLDMGASPASVIRARQTVPDLGALPAGLRPIIGHMLQPLPQDRPISMRALLAEAGAQPEANTGSGAGARPGSARSTEAGPRLPRTVAWLGGAVAAAAAAVALVLVSGVTEPSIDEVRGQLATVTSGYRCADLSATARADRTVTVSGFIASEQDLEQLRDAVTRLRGVNKVDFAVRPRIWPYCEVAALLKALSSKAGQGAAISLFPGASEPVVGGRLTLDIRAPNFDSYVYVDAFRSNGEVVHLFPSDKQPINLRPARNEFALGRRGTQDCWEFAGAPGQQMITLLAARRPLFGPPLPTSENARDYMARVRDALARDASGPFAASTLFYDLHPRQSAGLPVEPGCGAG